MEADSTQPDIVEPVEESKKPTNPLLRPGSMGKSSWHLGYDTQLNCL